MAVRFVEACEVVGLTKSYDHFVEWFRMRRPAAGPAQEVPNGPAASTTTDPSVSDAVDSVDASEPAEGNLPAYGSRRAAKGLGRRSLDSLRVGVLVLDADDRPVL